MPRNALAARNLHLGQPNDTQGDDSDVCSTLLYSDWEGREGGRGGLVGRGVGETLALGRHSCGNVAAEILSYSDTSRNVTVFGELYTLISFELWQGKIKINTLEVQYRCIYVNLTGVTLTTNLCGYYHCTTCSC